METPVYHVAQVPRKFESHYASHGQPDARNSPPYALYLHLAILNINHIPVAIKMILGIIPAIFSEQMVMQSLGIQKYNTLLLKI